MNNGISNGGLRGGGLVGGGGGPGQGGPFMGGAGGPGGASLQAMGQPQPGIPQQGAVLMVYGLNKDKMNADRIFNLLCLYGNVVRVSTQEASPCSSFLACLLACSSEEGVRGGAHASEAALVRKAYRMTLVITQEHPPSQLPPTHKCCVKKITPFTLTAEIL